MNNLITILGPTATGKTTLAANLAYQLEGEVISGDSRQVYRGMDLGTGKDLKDFEINGVKVPYHLIDIVDPGYEYNVFEFQKDFIKAFKDINKREKTAILCGGSGLYLESVIDMYHLVKVPENNTLRMELENHTIETLINRLTSYKIPHNTSDTTDRKRLIRAIEIQEHYLKSKEIIPQFPVIKHQIFGVEFERSVIRERITKRLKQRLDEGMLKEIETLLNKGLKAEQLTFYGLEYRYLTQYVIGEISYEEMFRLLNTAIHQFAKRQMTWFRRMEKKGIKIHWIDGNLTLQEKSNIILNQINN